MKTKNLFFKLVLVGICLVLGSAGIPGHAASLITVNTLTDENDGSCSDADCSLRDAIQVALPGDTINFSVNGTIFLNSQLQIDKQLIISGPGWDHITLSGNNATRVIYVTSLGDLTIRYLTIRNGNGTGGGIYNFGNVMGVGIVVVDHHFTSGNGGAINNQGTLTLISASVSNNSTSGDGGGIYNQGTLDAQRSTFYANTSAFGAGIKNEGGTASIVNCTFYANNASARGGGLDSGSGSTLSVVNSTFWGNTGGGGLGNPDSTSTVVNTIIASNTGGNCSAGAFTELSNHNMSTDGSCSPGFTQVTAAQLKLSWGGFPVTIGIDSVAIDAGTNDGCPPLDQMGTPRPLDGNFDGIATCDVGSDEIMLFRTFLPLVIR